MGSRPRALDVPGVFAAGGSPRPLLPPCWRAGGRPGAAARALVAPHPRLVPSRVEPEGEATLVVQAINLGNAATAGNYPFADVCRTASRSRKPTSSPALRRPTSNSKSPKTLTRPDFGPEGEFGVEEFCTESAASLSCASESPCSAPNCPNSSSADRSLRLHRNRLQDQGRTGVARPR